MVSTQKDVSAYVEVLPGELVVNVVTEVGGVAPTGEPRLSCNVRVNDAVTRESGFDVPVVVEESLWEYTEEAVVNSVRVGTDVTQGLSKAAETSVN
jgi:hypothetical protein